MAVPHFGVIKPKAKAKGFIRYRVVNDYRFLNTQIKRVTFPAPLVANVLDAISKGSTDTLTALDLRHGFFQQSLDERDRHLTAFADTTGSLYQYK